MKHETAPAPSPEPPQEQPLFADVYAQGVNYVWRTLRRLGVPEDDCPDAMQEVFLIVHRRLPEYEPRNRLLGWLAAITVKVAAQDRHKKGRKPLVDHDTDPADAPVPADLPPLDLEDSLAKRNLALYLLRDIEPERAIVLCMHEIEELTTVEIAEDLALPKGTVETRLRLAREDFKAAWKRYEARTRHETKRASLLLILGPLTLLEAERDAPPLPREMKDRVWERLRHLDHGGDGGGGGGDGCGGSTPPMIAAASGAGPAVSGALSATTVAIAFGGLFLLGVLLGALWDPLHRAPPPPRTDTVVTPAATPAAPSAAPSPGEVPPFVGSRFSGDAPPSATARVAAVPAAMPDIAIERALLKQASDALDAGRIPEALGAVGEHARLCHGAGRLADVRETLWIRALLRAGRIGEARGRIERFARLYPGHPMLSGLRAAAGTSP